MAFFVSPFSFTHTIMKDTLHTGDKKKVTHIKEFYHTEKNKSNNKHDFSCQNRYYIYIYIHTKKNTHTHREREYSYIRLFLFF
jgi:hypothetical protein